MKFNGHLVTAQECQREITVESIKTQIDGIMTRVIKQQGEVKKYDFSAS